jgi:hypothetical protein
MSHPYSIRPILLPSKLMKILIMMMHRGRETRRGVCSKEWPAVVHLDECACNNALDPSPPPPPSRHRVRSLEGPSLVPFQSRNAHMAVYIYINPPRPPTLSPVHPIYICVNKPSPDIIILHNDSI